MREKYETLLQLATEPSRHMVLKSGTHARFDAHHYDLFLLHNGHNLLLLDLLLWHDWHDLRHKNRACSSSVLRHRLSAIYGRIQPAESAARGGISGIQSLCRPLYIQAADAAKPSAETTFRNLFHRTNLWLLGSSSSSSGGSGRRLRQAATARGGSAARSCRVASGGSAACGCGTAAGSCTMTHAHAASSV